jgi:hypothetical protein
MEWLRPTRCDPLPDEVTTDTLAIFMQRAKSKLPLDKIVVPITPKTRQAHAARMGMGSEGRQSQGRDPQRLGMLYMQPRLHAR